MPLTRNKVKKIFLSDLNIGYSLKDYCDFWGYNLKSANIRVLRGIINPDYRHLFYRQKNEVFILTNLIEHYPPSILFPSRWIGSKNINYTLSPTKHMVCNFYSYCIKWNLNIARFSQFINGLDFGQHLRQGDALLLPMSTSPILAFVVSQNRLFGEKNTIKDFIKCFNTSQNDTTESPVVHLRSEFAGKYIKVSDLLPNFKDILIKKYGKKKIEDLEDSEPKDVFLKPFRSFFIIDDIEPIEKPSYEMQHCLNWDIVNMCLHISDPSKKPLTKWDFEKWETDGKSYDDTDTEYGKKFIRQFNEYSIGMRGE